MSHVRRLPKIVLRQNELNEEFCGNKTKEFVGVHGARIPTRLLRGVKTHTCQALQF